MLFFLCLLIAVGREPGLGKLFAGLPARNLELDDIVFRWVADETQRLAAVGDDPDLLLQHAAVERDAAVGVAEIFLRAVEDRALCFPGHHVLAGETRHLVFALGRFERRQILDGRPRRLCYARAVFRRAEGHPDDIGVLIVDRCAEVDYKIRALRRIEHIREDERVAGFLVGPATVRECAFLQYAGPERAAHFLELELLDLAAVIFAALHAANLELVRVEINGVRRVDGVLHRLEPIALVYRQDDDFLHAVLAHEKIPARQKRRRLRPHVGEKDSRQLFDAVGRVLDLVLEAGLFRLERLLEALAVGVELPAVVGAANAVGLERAVIERSGAVRAVIAEERPTSAAVAEEHQLFIQYFKSLLRLLGGDLGGGTDGVPVAPQEIARRRAGTDARHHFVVFFGEHGTALRLTRNITRGERRCKSFLKKKPTISGSYHPYLKY